MSFPKNGLTVLAVSATSAGFLAGFRLATYLSTRDPWALAFAAGFATVAAVALAGFFGFIIAIALDRSRS